MKDPNNENGHLFNAVELEAKAVFGRLEEPLIVAPYSEARRGISHVGRRPVGDLSEKASDQLRGGTPMEVVYPRCSGLDVHKRFVVACLSIIQNGQRHKELRQVSTMTSDILALKDWLKASGCRQIAMESTGVYWKPIFHVLEDEFEIVLVNAQHMKAIAFPKNGCERCGMDSGSAPTRLVESEFHSQQRATSCARSDPEPDELAKVNEVAWSIGCKRCLKMPTSNWPRSSPISWG
jgi:hypothetical protein